MTYNYTKLANIHNLEREIQDSAITIALDGINSNGTQLTISFKASLSQSEETILNQIVADHDGSIPSSVDPLSVVIDDVEVDEQGRQIVRTAAGQKGWTYLSHCIEIETSKLGGVVSDFFTGSSDSGLSIKFYNASNVELITQQDIDNDCVRTEVIIKPDHDYEIIGGNIYQHTRPTQDIRLWVMGGIPELGNNYLKEMVRNLNLKFLSEHNFIETDGRASKYMRKTTTGVPYNTNQLKLIFRHPAGVKQQLMIILEYYRA